MTIFPETLNFCMLVELCYLGTVKGTFYQKANRKINGIFKTKWVKIFDFLCDEFVFVTVFVNKKKGYLIMFLHSWAHFLHASAHCLHASILSPIFSHSIAHASHMSTGRGSYLRWRPNFGVKPTAGRLPRPGLKPIRTNLRLQPRNGRWRVDRDACVWEARSAEIGLGSSVQWRSSKAPV